MKRLEAVADCIDKVKVFADIGCDHGLISKYVSDNRLAELLYVCDVSAPSLLKAQRLLQGRDEVRLLVSDGFGQIPEKVDLAVIAGLGGLSIIEILKNKSISVDKLVLQPQNNAYYVRKYLSVAGYAITRDFTAFEGGKYYDVIKCELGIMTLDETAAQNGVFYKNKDELLKERLKKSLMTLKSYKQTNEVVKKIKIITEALKWQE